MNCPQCGAPANITPGVSTYECPFCKRSFNTLPQQAAPPPSALPPGYPPPQPPHIVVIAPPSGYGPTPPALRVRPSGGGFGWVVPFLVIGVIAAVVGGMKFWWIGSGDLFGGGWSWDGKEPLECGGNDQLTVKGVNANLPGTAIIAGGNCHVKIVDSTIKADTVVEATGNAEVTFQNGTVDGKVAADASGNARVRFNGTKVTGEKKRSGNAKVD
ncbi:hypothetical protein BH09MYX1_BH09MYX1_18600 [soil metagenome]